MVDNNNLLYFWTHLFNVSMVGWLIFKINKFRLTGINSLRERTNRTNQAVMSYLPKTFKLPI